MSLSTSAREWGIRLALMLGSLLVAAILAEIVVRIVYPISDGRDNVTLDGKSITDHFEPGIVYRQVSNEYDAITTITDKGHRVPGTDGSPDIIFLGDSFTYGWGLADDDTYASIYCNTLKLKCVNLGYPGSGTHYHAQRLKEFLDRWNWRPREVKLFFFGMSTSFSAGNDFVDNYSTGRRLKQQSMSDAEKATMRKEESGDKGLTERIIDLQGFLLDNINLLRVAKYHFGPLLKTIFVADPGKERMTEAIGYTREAFKQLDELSQQYGFEYNVYLIVPVQDITRGSHTDTLKTLEDIVGKPVVNTAPALLESPQDYYFSYDGHLNEKGARKIAEYLIAREKTIPETK